MAGSRNRSAARHLSCNGKKSDANGRTLDSAPNSIGEEKSDSGILNWTELLSVQARYFNAE